jgi:pimeloyl-ACP methyl ester carboxylesterase
MPRLLRRKFLEGALGLALLPLTGAAISAGTTDGGGAKRMTRDIVMLHGANEGAWCFDKFKTVFEGLGFTCHAPDLIGHGTRAQDAAKTLVGVGMADYRAELEGFLKTIPPQPVLLGHSMGAVLAQLLAAQGLARALVLVAPAPRAGILPETEGEKKLGQDLMGLGAFWKGVINPDFDLARLYTLNGPGGSRTARRVRQIRSGVGPRLLRAVLLDVRSNRGDGGRHRSRHLSGVVPCRKRRQARVGRDGAAGGGISWRDLL